MIIGEHIGFAALDQTMMARLPRRLFACNENTCPQGPYSADPFDAPPGSGVAGFGASAQAFETPFERGIEGLGQSTVF